MIFETNNPTDALSPDIESLPAGAAAHYATMVPKSLLSTIGNAIHPEKPGSHVTILPLGHEVVTDERPFIEAKNFEEPARAQLPQNDAFKREKNNAIERIYDMLDDARAKGDFVLVKKLDELLKNVLKATDSAGISASLSAAESVASGADAGADKAETLDQANKEIARLDKIIDAGEEKLKAAGYYDEEYEKWLKREKDKLAQMQPSTAEYYQQQEIIAQGQETHARAVEAEAIKRGDTASAQTAGEVADAANQKNVAAKAAVYAANPANSLKTESVPIINPQPDAEPAKNNILASLESKPSQSASVTNVTSTSNNQNNTDGIVTASPEKSHDITAITQTLNNSGVVGQTTEAQAAETNTQPAAQLANLTVPKPASGKTTGLFG